MGTAVVVLGAGSGTRVGADRNKVFLSLGPQTIIGRSVATALAVPGVARVVVVAAPGEEPDMAAALGHELGERAEGIILVTGGALRQDSERNALRVLAPAVEAGEIDVVAIHDGARPLAPVALYEQVLGAAREHGGAIPTTPIEGLATRALEPVAGTMAVQTPQAFRAGELLAAYEAATATFTDTAGCWEAHTGRSVAEVPGTPLNLKVTWPEDVTTAQALSESPTRPSLPRSH